MTVYEYLRGKEEKAKNLANDYFKKNEIRMAKFYFNASLGYRLRYEKMTIKELGEEYAS